MLITSPHHSVCFTEHLSPSLPRLVLFSRKFSIKAFSSDILKYDCVAVQYIGELARYLVNAPPNPNDHKLNVRYAMGNGLSGDVWTKFQVRVR